MPKLPDVLKKIIDKKHEELIEFKKNVAQSELELQLAALPPTRGFLNALKLKNANSYSAVIAEIKKASPSKGVLRDVFEPSEIALSYEKAGAACLSVLTDVHFFQGSNQYLREAKAASSLPILRKDFVIDPYQIYESRVLGADCILLIVACLSDDELKSFYALATSIGLDVLIEVHDEVELQRALVLNPPMIGINNRDLRTFNVSLLTTISLIKSVPKDILIITESGIGSQDDVFMMQEYNINAFLVGEAFMSAKDPGAALSKIFFD